MIPLHAGHSQAESVVVLALAAVVVGTAFALTRGGWTRIGALVGVAVVAGGSGVGIEALGVHGGEMLHLASHGLELSALALLAVAGYYVLFDARASAPADE